MDPSGNPANPAMPDRLREKFSLLVAPLVGGNRAAALQDSFAHLDENKARRIAELVAV